MVLIKFTLLIGLYIILLSLQESKSLLTIGKIKLFNHRILQQTLLTKQLMSAMSSPINKQDFKKLLPLIGLIVPSNECSTISSKYKKYLFQRSRMKRVYPYESNPEKRIVLLTETITNPTVISTHISSEFQSYLTSIQAEPIQHNIELSYDDLSTDEILHTYLPPNSEIPSSFEQIGHIAHINLRDEFLPYKHIIGQVIIDKNPAIKTVVNKVGTIETEFRTFPMEVIGGDSNFDVILKESNAVFHFNFEQVYWNSRLQMEHSRLVDLIMNTYIPNNNNRSSNESTQSAPKKDKYSMNNHNNQHSRDQTNNKAKGSSVNQYPSTTSNNNSNNSNNNSSIVIADMMAGVGPFAVPLAMTKHFIVHANDLNPASYKYLEKNKQINKCYKHLHCYNMDGRQLIIDLAKQNIPIHEVIMNLPATALEFLDVFIGYHTRYTTPSTSSSSSSPTTITTTSTATNTATATTTTSTATATATVRSIVLPRIHVYCFSTSLDPVSDIIQRAAVIMKCTPQDIHIDTHHGKIQLKDSKKRKLSKILELKQQGTTTMNSAVTQDNSNNNNNHGHNHNQDQQLSSVPIDLSTIAETTDIHVVDNTAETETENNTQFQRTRMAHIVRDVSPNKVMICLSFILPLKVALAEPVYL